MDQPGRRKEIRLGLDLLPKPGKELHFTLKFLPGAALCRRPHDHAHPFGLDLGKQVLEPLALGLVHDLAGYAHMIHRGHQNHHPPRKCDMRGDPGAFGSSLLLQNLHHDLLALLEHIADIHLLQLLIDVLRLFPFKFKIRFIHQNIARIEKCVFVQAHVHKRRLHSRKDIADTPFIGIPHQSFAAAHLHMDLRQLAILQKRHPRLMGINVCDNFFFHERTSKKLIS